MYNNRHIIKPVHIPVYVADRPCIVKATKYKVKDKTDLMNLLELIVVMILGNSIYTNPLYRLMLVG